MSIDRFIRAYAHQDWLETPPVGPITRRYSDYLQNERYGELTTCHYLSAVAHFNHWASSKRLSVSDIRAASITEFMERHLATCDCQKPRFRGRGEIAAALRHLLTLLLREGLIELARSVSTPVSAELQAFHQYLADTRGLATSTCEWQIRVVREFLEDQFGGDSIDLSRLSPRCVDDWIVGLTTRYQPSSLGVIRTSLQSYFRYRALRGDSTAALSAALPVLACRGEAKLIVTLTDAQLARVLESFDLSCPMGLRDRAMARCLGDLGLRGQEVTRLTLDDVDWRAGTVTMRKTKGQRVRVLPLPVTTGAALAEYLRKGRPKTCIRRLFVRHVAPVDRPLGRAAAARAINGAFARSGLVSLFSGTHVLRRTLATRLQRCGSSLKFIADVLGHRELQTTTRYAKVDFERLRRIALPWAGRQS
jgi:integrase/recombinase XerD